MREAPLDATSRTGHASSAAFLGGHVQQQEDQAPSMSCLEKAVNKTAPVMVTDRSQNEVFLSGFSTSSQKQLLYFFPGLCPRFPSTKLRNKKGPLMSCCLFSTGNEPMKLKDHSYHSVIQQEKRCLVARRQVSSLSNRKSTSHPLPCKADTLLRSRAIFLQTLPTLRCHCCKLTSLP